MSPIKTARPAILIAHTRSGGTFLAHCLSTHPDIFCPRGEPLLPSHSWRQSLPRHVPSSAILGCILHAFHYEVGMCRITYVQANTEVCDYLRSVEAKVILLERQNLLRCAVSQTLMNMTSRGEIEYPLHSVQTVALPGVTLRPLAVLERCRWQAEWQANMRKTSRSLKLRVLRLTYVDIVGGEMVNADRLPLATTERITSFLGVEQYPMLSPLRAVSPRLLRDIVANWDELKAVIQKSEFAHYLEEEKE